VRSLAKRYSPAGFTSKNVLALGGHPKVGCAVHQAEPFVQLDER
jgi:hypothetical protein